MPAELVTAVDGDDVVVRYADPGHRADRVAVWPLLRAGHPTLAQVEGGWEVRLTPPVDRFEYLLDVDGELRLDPGNPHVVPVPSGAHSWLPLPGYRRPGWLALEPVEAVREPVRVRRSSAGRIEAEIWAPSDARPGERLPMLVCHDGPEMDTYGGLTTYVGAMIGAGRLPRMRVALVAPGSRTTRYAASPRYARALRTRLLPALRDTVQVAGRPVLMGQSLGALAALHAAWTDPGAFAGLFLQSGSYFTPELDGRQSDLRFWAAVTGFVAGVHAAERAAPDAPVTTLVCGTAEENYANNVAMRHHLARAGVETGWGEVRDGHTWTCWRDTLDPHLTELLLRVWS